MPSIEELESQAAAFSQRGDTQATERVCREILALDRNPLSSLRFLADLALGAGDFESAAAHLQMMLVT
jgi:cytochrome c-type biogenesis protein CcmH/NrfG